MKTRITMLKDSKSIWHEKSKFEDSDYIFLVKNTKDFGWDGDNKKDREATAKAYFSNMCSDIIIVDESPIKTGEYALEKPALTWVSKVKCINN